MDFEIELEALIQARLANKNAINNLKDSMNILKNSINLLKNGEWTGKSKEAFFSLSYGEWEKGIEGHIKKLELLESMLKVAEIELGNLETETNRLDI